MAINLYNYVNVSDSPGFQINKKGEIAMNFLWGLGGIIVILGIAYLFSVKRRSIQIRTILIALALQIFFCLYCS